MPLSVSVTFSRTLFGPALSLNSSETLNCNTVLSLIALDIFELFILHLSVGLTDFPVIWIWKLGNSYKSKPGLEDYVYHYMSTNILFSLLLFIILDMNLFSPHFHSENNQ